MPRVDPLTVLADLASVLDSAEYKDSVSPKQSRAFREVADNMQAALENVVGELTVHGLVSFMLGMEAQKTVVAQQLPMAVLTELLAPTQREDPAQMAVKVALAYLARDLLAGERTD